MAETARIHDDAPKAGESKPTLQLVHDIAGHDTGAAPEPDIGRSVVIGAVAGFLVVAVGITVAGTVGGIGFGGSLGLGVFVGIWGGGGFGFMMGATVPFARHLDAQSARSTDHGQGETNGIATR
jgi:hypothetical protein